MYPPARILSRITLLPLWHLKGESRSSSAVEHWGVYDRNEWAMCNVCMCVLPFPVFVIGGLLPSSSPFTGARRWFWMLPSYSLRYVRFHYVVFFSSRYLHCNCRPACFAYFVRFSSSFFIKYIHKQTLQLFSLMHILICSSTNTNSK